MEERLAHYTLTGASDWPMLAVVGGASVAILNLSIVALVGVIYRLLPKHHDLQAMRADVNLDIEKLATRFESVLEKYIAREQDAREKKDNELKDTCTAQRKECQARNDKQFSALFRGKT